MADAAILSALWLSLKVAGVAVLWVLPLAFGLAALLALGRFPGRWLLDGVVHLPVILPPVVLGYGLLLVFGIHGPVGGWLDTRFGIRLAFSWQGAALAAGLAGLPFQVRAIRQAIEAIDPGLLQAAASRGAGPLDRLVTVVLPLALPGLLAGAMTGFAVALGAFGAVITFAANIPGETRTLPLAIYSAIQTPGGEAMAGRLSLLSVALALGMLLLGNGLARWLDRLIRGRDAREQRR